MLRTSVLKTLRNTTRNGVNWDQLRSKLTDGSAVSALESLRSAYAEVEREQKKYAKSPAAIDFDSFKEKIKDTSLVDSFKEEYANIKYPEVSLPTAGEFDSLPDSLKAAMKEMNEAEKAIKQMAIDSKANLDESKQRISELEEMIQLMEATRTTLDTTVDEVEAQYPEITEEIDQEIAEYNWEKDA